VKNADVESTRRSPTVRRQSLFSTAVRAAGEPAALKIRRQQRRCLIEGCLAGVRYSHWYFQLFRQSLYLARAVGTVGVPIELKRWAFARRPE
jgi:hypothetical protein